MEYRGSKSNNHARIGVKYCAAGFRNLFAGEFQPAPSAMRESGDRNVNTMNGWRRERDSNPRYGVNPYNALAGRPLRPLGHLSGRAAHYITRVRASFPASGRLIEFECLVQGPHGELHVFFVDDDRNLDLRGGDHLDVDALFGEGAEHLACDSGVGAHADAHHRDLADLVVAANVCGFDVVLDLQVEYVERLLVLVAVHGERQVGQAVYAGVLDDHVDVDVGVADRPEDRIGDAGSIGHAHDGDLRFVAVERYS